MPQPRKYESQAAKQRAYRARLASQNRPTAKPGAPGYPRWRKAIAEATALLDSVYEELNEWMQERSEKWQESDRAGELEADKDMLYEATELLANLAILAPKE